MYRKAGDFLIDWTASAPGTLSVMKAITDDKMNTAIVEGHNSLGWLAWHLVGTAGAFGQLAGLNTPAIERGTEVPERMGEIVEKYEAVIDAYNSEAKKFTDEMMTEEINVFGGKMIRGKFLRMLIDHQTHHRGQMTVLLRQAGLTVPGVMGPTKEMQ
ncbi:damage-inducible protein DinB [Paenibacillus anaericanus]|uniref:Damage-inducible protein DinB n=1 Tax=Paenibacillus anaericanus TaxID=170367 RepID=A0A433Y9V6_9BACL|nr:DinB family protein [Paenibacillus anaericanus]RUT46690.1 damage-inducible protein DinB [Paenibacillus anaericanus]